MIWLKNLMIFYVRGFNSGLVFQQFTASDWLIEPSNQQWIGQGELENKQDRGLKEQDVKPLFFDIVHTSVSQAVGLTVPSVALQSHILYTILLLENYVHSISQSLLDPLS